MDISMLYNFFNHSISWVEFPCLNDYKHVWQHKTDPKFILAKSGFTDSGHEIVSEIYANEGIYTDQPSPSNITSKDIIEHANELQ